MDLPLTAVDYRKVTILIGSDNFDVMQPLALRKPPSKSQPFGVLTPLGWTVVGRTSQQFKGPVKRFVMRITVEKSDSAEPELEIYERFWNTESFGTRVKTQHRNTKPYAVDWPSSFRLVGGRYEVGLLWKENRTNLPNNRSMAMGRFLSLCRKLRSDKTLYEQYRDAMSNLVCSGIVRAVAPTEENLPYGKVWYLPHKPVRHRAKPGRVRVVFDASAKFDVISLNDNLSKGPDLLCHMTTLLIRFRLLPVAVTSDVSSMFHQVGVPVEDRSVLRFLWNESMDASPNTYEFTRQVFGLTSSPACCNYALLRCIFEFLPENMASRFGRRFYVDNYLDSFSGTQEAIEHCVPPKEALSRRGFPLVKWASSSQGLLRSFSEQECSKSQVNLNLGTTCLENVLGLCWDCETDTLCFPVCLPKTLVTT
uniref:Peptidase aspartic putative domain-containing protein n=1 Tax=Trichuris muris TaxID=70415 RepID=A0A5S6QZV6_TRIMR